MQSNNKDGDYIRFAFLAPKDKAERFKKLIEEGHFMNESDGMREALTLLLEKYDRRLKEDKAIVEG